MSEEAQKSSSEILNELFSTFNSTYQSSPSKNAKKESKKGTTTVKKKKKKRKRSGVSSGTDSDVDSRLHKLRKKNDDIVKKLKKKKRKEIVPKKKKKKGAAAVREADDPDSVPIGDGFVVLKKRSSKVVKELEDGEIVEEKERERDYKRKYESSSSGGGGGSSSTSSKVKKLSASQAYKLDAEERLLLGYEAASTTSSTSGYSHHNNHNHKGSYSSSSKRKRSLSPPSSSSSSSRSLRDDSSSRSRGGSRADPQPRLAPPRDSYRNSYMKFEKERDHYDDHMMSHHYHHHNDHSGSSRSYDTASYYDYHAERSREAYDSSRSGFGYVGKSYYYDDVSDKPGNSDNSSSNNNDSNKRYGTSAWRHRHRSRSKSPPRRSYYHPDDIIDKVQLLEVARKNAKKLLKSGVLPSDIFSRDQILAIKAGGKSVDELTLYCKRLAKRDASGDARSGSDSDDGGNSRNQHGHFIHHPFQVKDKPMPTITMNIRNSVPLPLRTPQTLAIESAKLRTQFPVSSGTQHRHNEIEWKPVQEEDAKKDDPNSKALVSLDSNNADPAAAASTATSGAPSINGGTEEREQTTPPENTNPNAPKAIEAPPTPTGQSNSNNTGISVDGPNLPDVDISSVIGLRLKAMRMLQENPECGEARQQLDDAAKMMKSWADAKALEPKFLTPAELQSGPQAWAKRDQLRKLNKLDSGMGMHLLQKMGWRPGEGLGKNKEGQLEPLALDIKTDKKGLTAAVEELMYGKSKGGGGGPSMPVVYDLSGKHPVSALMELTAKRRWGNPEFELCFEHGPPHKRQFVYKVIVNGISYQPSVAVGNKKQAKANAAAFCLQSLGLLPTQMLQSAIMPEGPLNEKFGGAPTFLQTVPLPSTQPEQPPNSPNVSMLMPPPPPPPPLL